MWQEHGGPEKYDDQVEATVECILWVKPSHRGPKFLVAWAGYDHTFYTWESSENILDKLLVKNFKAVFCNGDSLFQVLHASREAVWGAVWKRKEPEMSVVVPVPCAALGTAARPLLAYLSRPPSTAGKEPLEIQKVDKHGYRVSKLEIPGVGDAAWVLLGQVHRPGQAYGSTVVHKGKEGDRSIYYVGGPITITCVSLTPCPDHG